MADGSLIDTAYLAGIVANTELWGFIDSTAHLSTARVWFMSASNDTVVARSVVEANAALTAGYLADPSTQLATVYDVVGEHAQLTDDYGNNCVYLGSPYINRCGFAAALAALQWLYPGAISPAPMAVGTAVGDVAATCTYDSPATAVAAARDDRIAALPRCAAPAAAAAAGPLATGVPPTPVLRGGSGTLYSFDQGLFVDGGGWTTAVGLAETAFVYIPDACLANATSPTVCTLHAAFHGCLQTVDDIGTQFMTDGGFMALADTNNLVILFPQAVSNLLNPKGCFDWWGYAGPQYASNIGTQTLAVKRMLDVLMGNPITPNRSATHAAEYAAFSAAVPLPRRPTAAF